MCFTVQYSTATSNYGATVKHSIIRHCSNHAVRGRWYCMRFPLDSVPVRYSLGLRHATAHEHDIRCTAQEVEVLYRQRWAENYGALQTLKRRSCPCITASSSPTESREDPNADVASGQTPSIREALVHTSQDHEHSLPSPPLTRANIHNARCQTLGEDDRIVRIPDFSSIRDPPHISILEACRFKHRQSLTNCTEE